MQWGTYTTDQKHETSRLKHAYTYVKRTWSLWMKL